MFQPTERSLEDKIASVLARIDEQTDALLAVQSANSAERSMRLLSKLHNLLDILLEQLHARDTER